MSVPVQEILGWTASLLTLATFVQRSMIPLRVTAIGANAFFIAYGAIGHFAPVLALHVLLLPVNSAQLVVALRQRAGEEAGAGPFAPDEIAQPRVIRFR